MLPPVDLCALLPELLAAGQALARLDGLALTLPETDPLISLMLRKEAVASSQREGRRASLQEVLRFEAHLAQPGDARDVQAALHHLSVLEAELARVNSLGSASPELEPVTAELHSLPPLIRIALRHAQLERHPPTPDEIYRQRLLVPLRLRQAGLLRLPLLPLSGYFQSTRGEYALHLQVLRDQADGHGWLRYFLKGIQLTAKAATEQVCQLLALREHDRALIARSYGRRAGNALVVLNQLIRQPYLNTPQVMALTGQTYQPSKSLVGELVRLGLLAPVGKRQRDRVFEYRRALEILQQDIRVPEEVAQGAGRQG